MFSGTMLCCVIYELVAIHKCNFATNCWPNFCLPESDHQLKLDSLKTTDLCNNKTRWHHLQHRFKVENNSNCVRKVAIVLCRGGDGTFPSHQQQRLLCQPSSRRCKTRQNLFVILMLTSFVVVFSVIKFISESHLRARAVHRSALRSVQMSALYVSLPPATVICIKSSPSGGISFPAWKQNHPDHNL